MTISISGVTASSRARGARCGVGRQRDLDLLRFIGEQVAVDEVLLRKLRRVSSQDTNRRWRRKYKEQGLIRCERLLPDSVYTWLTREGLRSLSLDFKYIQPSVGKLRHTVAVAEVRHQLERQLRLQGAEYRWVSERELYGELARGTHMPDGEILLADGTTTAVEVELALKRKARMTDIAYELLGSYDKVQYFCLPAPGRQLRGIIERESLSRITVNDYERKEQ